MTNHHSPTVSIRVIRLFGFSSGNLFSVDSFAKRLLIISTVAIAIRLFVDVWFIFAYSGVDVRKFHASIVLHSAIRSRSQPQKSFLLLSEWLLLVIPLLLSMTLFAHRPGTLSAILLLPTAFICFLFPTCQSGTPLPSGGSPRSSFVSHRASSSHHDKPSKQGAGSPEQTETTRLSALSTYRTHMMLVTVLAILAVDFPVFPRMLAKCETYGVSFMDMGVGSFVFSQGIVSAIPVIQSEILSVLEKSLPVLVLGLLHVVLVKGTQYPRWQTLISANKEGLVSLTGYLAIHLLGLSTVTFIIPHSPSYFRRQQAAVQKRRNSDAGARADASTNTAQHRVSMPVHHENDKTATVLFSYAVIYWTLFGISRYLHIGGPDVSRRLTLAVDIYGSYFFSTLSSRIPLIALIISVLTLVSFLGAIAWVACL
ncbi:hypothetical protein F5888DRAFT_1827738 [Russula emetica]|nr:hypothetical protein F5888DRAFT_1827738 [Russula emetica]